jgi:hypothetical protein
MAGTDLIEIGANLADRRLISQQRLQRYCASEGRLG